MAKWLSRIVVLAIVVLVVGEFSATAQERGRRGRGRTPQFGRGGFGTGNTARILQNRKVQEELKITADQAEKIDQAIDADRIDFRELFQGGGNFREMTEEQREERMAEVRKKTEEAEKVVLDNVSTILDAEQNARFKELQLQRRGVSALNDAEAAGQLGLRPDQVLMIEELFYAQTEKRREMFESMRNVPREEMREKFGEMRSEMEEQQKQTEKSVMAILTPQQAAQWSQMQGATFDFGSDDEEDRGRGRRGRRGN